MARFSGKRMKRMVILCSLSCRKMYRKNISKRLPTRAFLGLPPAKDVSICAVQLRYYTNNSVLNVWQWSAAVISAAVSPKRD